MKTGVIKLKKIALLGNRIDSSVHLSEGVKVRDELKKLPYKITTIFQTSENMFIGNIFSRNWVGNPKFGATYLAASDSVLSDLEVGRYLSRKQAQTLSYLKVKEGWILVTCSGTLGEVAFTNSNYTDKILTHDLLRIVPNDNLVKRGVVYAYLASKYGYYQISQSQFGGVVKHINASQAGLIPIPIFPDSFQESVNKLVMESSKWREEATTLLNMAKQLMKEKTGLAELSPDKYDSFGQHSFNRKVSCFSRNINDIGTTTINAFNHSQRIRSLKEAMPCQTKVLSDVLENGKPFSTSSFPRLEVKSGFGVMLINQSDIFDNIVRGKYISKRNVNLTNLVKYGEVLIAGVGTLGESESFCRTIFANEDLEGQLVSGEFVRMKTKDNFPSGYLYIWLSSDYGFRFLRNIQAGTKLCRPIPKLLLNIPVPVIDIDSMQKIDRLVREAHTKRHEANQKELKAISMVEEEIEKWNN